MNQTEDSILARIRDQSDRLVKAFDKAMSDGATCHYRHAMIRACLLTARNMAEELEGGKVSDALRAYDTISFFLWCLIERLHDLDVEPEELLDLMKKTEILAHRMKVLESAKNREIPAEPDNAQKA